MAKIHKFQKVQKSNTNKAIPEKRAKLPIFPRLVNWFKIENARHSYYTYDASWNAAFKTFTLLRSIAKGVKKLEVLIVSSTFKIMPTEVDAIVMDYSVWLDMKLLAEQMRAIHSYVLSFKLLDNRTIGAVIKGEHTEVCNTAGNLVQLRKTEDNSKPRRNNNTKIVLVDEYFFVYIRDIGLYGMVRAQHQENSQKKEAAEPESEIA